MNIFNKTFLAISLAFAIPLSTQAHWFSNLTNAITNKKETLATAAVLGGTLSYSAIKLVDFYYHLLSMRTWYCLKGLYSKELKDAHNKRNCENVQDLYKRNAKRHEIIDCLKRNHEKLKDIYALMDERYQELRNLQAITQKTNRKIAAFVALGISAISISIAHYLNIFGENT